MLMSKLNMVIAGYSNIEYIIVSIIISVEYQ